MENPEKIYAGMDNEGGTYWMRKRHEAFDKTDVMKQEPYIKLSSVTVPEGLQTAIDSFEEGTFYDGDALIAAARELLRIKGEV